MEPISAEETIYLTTSWDDGDPRDTKLAELLVKYGIAGTFYIPKSNIEGRDVVSETTITALSSQFEIGSHTLDHIFLPGQPESEITHQIMGGKKWLQDVLGHEVKGFCYPGGKLNKHVVNAVRSSGFAYARTIENLRITVNEDIFRVPTTIQFYPTPKNVFVRNFLTKGIRTEKIKPLLIAMQEQDYVTRMILLFEHALMEKRIFHLWGHSWELEKHNLWQGLETFLKHIQQYRQQIVFCTNWDMIKNVHQLIQAPAL